MNSGQPQSPSEQPPQPDVLLYVEQEAPSKFKIQSDQLELIGAKLRGRRSFSVFNSIVLPAIVTLLTTLLTGGFQYISWQNSVRLQNATDIADKATETYEKAATAIGKRTYATLIFVPSARDLAHARPLVPARTTQVTASADGNIVTGSLAAPRAGVETPMAKITDALAKTRFDSYYEHLKHWNETYEQLVTDIDYNLDRPLFQYADITRTGFQIFNAKLEKIDCKERLTSQLKLQGLNSNSLKLQFAGIHHCFRKIHADLDGEISRAVASDAVADSFAPDVTKEANKQLGDMKTMANEFRCYALRRIDYYKRQKEQSILSPEALWRRVFRTRKQEAQRHFEITEERCDSNNRPT